MHELRWTQSGLASAGIYRPRGVPTIEGDVVSTGMRAVLRPHPRSVPRSMANRGAGAVLVRKLVFGGPPCASPVPSLVRRHSFFSAALRLSRNGRPAPRAEPP